MASITAEKRPSEVVSPTAKLAVSCSSPSSTFPFCPSATDTGVAGGVITRDTATGQGTASGISLLLPIPLSPPLVMWTPEPPPLLRRNTEPSRSASRCMPTVAKPSAATPSSPLQRVSSPFFRDDEPNIAFSEHRRFTLGLLRRPTNGKGVQESRGGTLHDGQDRSLQDCGGFRRRSRWFGIGEGGMDRMHGRRAHSKGKFNGVGVGPLVGLAAFGGIYGF